ncbi:FAD-binding and (Fe-S)-binding domain-containing protein [Arthrobacter sp. AOP36-A1-22]|uniref:FAD-binding and (Fe-S)-binding domain-containing protein n=1 Tax=unclassified Arthrobacter TaxID=235627 RepID=UPI00403430A3
MTQIAPPSPPAVTAILHEAGIEVDTSPRRLSEYSYDASNYRVEPIGVVFPHDADQVAAIVQACHGTGTPLTGRGGGTSMAGNAVGPGLVLDTTPYFNDLLAIDEENLWVDVEPGMVLATLSTRIEAHTSGRLTFAPDPSSKNRATVGGAIGNDACGNHSVRYGRTSDHVVEIDLVTVEGIRLTATATGIRATNADDVAAVRRAAGMTEALEGLAQENLAGFRTDLGRIQRQVSGYHLEHLLPEKGFNIARAFVGSEGTCALVVRARMALVPKPASALLLCVGYPDVVEAARDIETILEFSPAAVEGIDDAIVATMKSRRGEDSVTGLPEGKAWLYIDLDGTDPASVQAQADELLERLRGIGRMVDGRVVPDTTERASLWRVREDGAGLSARLSTGGESWPGWEDSAVAPERLADYLSDFRDLLAEHGLQGVMYGHFGAGCMHVRITYDLRSDAGRKVFREFTAAAAALVVSHGGSLSGEHGDGRARSEFLPLMYSPAMLTAFEDFRAIWDPTGLLNPGVMTSPDAFDENLLLAGVPARQWRTSFDLTPASGATGDGLDPFVHAVQGCIGIGRCRSATGGVMCPSYRATGDEKDSTRGRSRVLQDMVRGAKTVEEGWKSKEVREVLDLCLSCKACSTDCPTGVDMATYKSEFFSHYYAGRMRPLSHFSLGWLPRWLKITGRVAPLVNAVMGSPLGKLVSAAGGLTTKRALPRFASGAAWRREVDAALAAGPRRRIGPPRTLSGSGSPGSRVAAGNDAGAGQGTAGAVLFVDTFSRGFRPEVAGAAARVMVGTGEPVTCSAEACCGLTYISTGQLGTARRLLSKAARVLDDGTERPIVVIEPSCAAALSKDLPELVHTEAARRVAARIRSFAGHVAALAADGWTPEPAAPVPASVVLQTHCHEYSVFGAAVQRRALAALGVAEVTDATGCCGVAGNFGFEADHYEVSMKVADLALAPAMADSTAEVPVLADGFSCTMQVAQLDAGRRGLHLAELLDPAPPTDHARTTTHPKEHP